MQSSVNVFLSLTLLPINIALTPLVLFMGDRLVSWRSSDRTTRGTYDIISLCLATLFICVWSAVHVSIPPNPRVQWRITFHRIVWMLIGLFLPEVLVLKATKELIQAWQITKTARAYGWAAPLPVPKKHFIPPPARFLLAYTILMISRRGASSDQPSRRCCKQINEVCGRMTKENIRGP